jgi:hypothetical protein
MDYKIVPLRDDLISAARYAFMMRRNGKALDNCETYGRAPGTDVNYDPRPARNANGSQTQFARGTPNHPDGDFNVFTGE